MVLPVVQLLIAVHDVGQRCEVVLIALQRPGEKLCIDNARQHLGFVRRLPLVSVRTRTAACTYLLLVRSCPGPSTCYRCSEVPRPAAQMQPIMTRNDRSGVLLILLEKGRTRV